MFAVLLSVSVAHADVIYLKDGSRKEGKVVGNENGVVVLEVEIGKLKANLRYPEDEIERIEKMSPPAQAFEEKLAAIQADDLDAYYKLGLWAEERNLADQAKRAFEKAMRAGEGSRAAAARLGYVKLDSEWLPQADALRRLQETYDQGQFDAVYTRLSPLKDIPKEAVQHGLREDVFMLYAKSCERMGKWDEASKAWRLFAAANPRSKTNAAVAAVRIAILQEHPDGQYPCDKKDFPEIVLKNDPSVVPLLEQGGVKSLSDEAVMNLALKAKAGVLLEEARKYADQVVDYSDASIKAWRLALQKAATASRMLAGTAKDMRLEIIKRGFAFHDKQLQGAAQELEQNAKAAPQDPDVAQDCLEKEKKVLESYEDCVEFLKGVETDLPEEYAKAQEGAARETQRVKKSEEQVEVLKIRKRTADLDAKAVDALSKAQAADPRRQQYLTNTNTGEFQDGGKEWRARTSACIRLANKAYACLADMLVEYTKRPESFAADIERTKGRMNECDALRMQVAAIANRKGR
jgi:tetratricopeptide (TPR) repeat protein